VDAWLIWLIIAVVLLVVEMLTLTVAVGMLGVAALVAAGFAALGLPVFVQLLAFTVTATIGVLLIRPIVRHMRRPQLERFGVQALIGKPAYVVSEVSGLDGRVRIGGVGGEEWTARPYDQTLVIPAGAIVDVLEISGSTAFVYPRE
jgi:membrane protein implicated in regulation of membrane protease activity